jgi:hypothetical protein
MALSIFEARCGVPNVSGSKSVPAGIKSPHFSSAQKKPAANAAGFVDNLSLVERD